MIMIHQTSITIKKEILEDFEGIKPIETFMLPKQDVKKEEYSKKEFSELLGWYGEEAQALPYQRPLIELEYLQQFDVKFVEFYEFRSKGQSTLGDVNESSFQSFFPPLWMTFGKIKEKLERNLMIKARPGKATSLKAFYILR